MLVSTREQFAETVHSISDTRDDLVVLVGDISHGIFKDFAKKNPKNFYNVGILEGAMVSCGAGLAKVGLIPIMHTIAPFLIERAYEQIKLDFGYQQLPGNLVSIGGSFDYSNLGCTHHCYNELALISAIPNTSVMTPSSPLEFDQLFRQTYNNGLLNYYKIFSNNHNLPLSRDSIKYGEPAKITDGSDITLLSMGGVAANAAAAVKELNKSSLTADFYYISTIFPLNLEEIKESIMKTGKLLVVEEFNVRHGLASHIIPELCKEIRFEHETMGIPSEFISGYGTYQDLLSRAGLSVEHIKQQLQKITRPEFIKTL